MEPRLACVADPEHLHRILVNLIRNAAQAMKRHAAAKNVVTVRAQRAEHAVRNRGGRSRRRRARQNLRERLFEPFATSAPEAGGTGLGLAIARELTRAMGGELELTRTGAEGSTFRITLPVA